MPGPPPKRPGTRQRSGPKLHMLEPTKPATRLPADPAWSEDLKRLWAKFWDSPMSSTVMPWHEEPLRRLFGFYHRREAYQALGDLEPLVHGSTGQLVTNPLLKRVDVLDGKILALEDRFGGSPMALLRLQVTFGDAARSLADINAAVAARLAATDDAPDPRLVVPAAQVREPAADDRGLAAPNLRAVGGSLDRNVARSRRG
ncbi:MAG: hypothetical protein ACYDCI_06605 [Candidatus Limnocylindrales bacterium]